MTTDSSKQQKYSQRQGLLMLAIVLVPMIAAYVMFKTGWGMPAETINKGILLVPPQPVSELNLAENDKILSRLYPAEKKQWRIMVPVMANCEAACQQNLFITRQAHIRLAEKAYRVERILLTLDEVSPQQKQQLLEKHPNVRWLDSSRTALTNWLADTNLAATQPDKYYFLIDQDGFAMMVYNTEHSGQNLLDDLKRVLKYTYEK